MFGFGDNLKSYCGQTITIKGIPVYIASVIRHKGRGYLVGVELNNNLSTNSADIDFFKQNNDGTFDGIYDNLFDVLANKITMRQGDKMVSEALREKNRLGL